MLKLCLAAQSREAANRANKGDNKATVPSGKRAAHSRAKTTRQQRAPELKHGRGQHTTDPPPQGNEKAPKLKHGSKGGGVGGWH